MQNLRPRGFIVSAQLLLRVTAKESNFQFISSEPCEAQSFIFYSQICLHCEPFCYRFNAKINNNRDQMKFKKNLGNSVKTCALRKKGKQLFYFHLVIKPKSLRILSSARLRRGCDFSAITRCRIASNPRSLNPP